MARGVAVRMGADTVLPQLTGEGGAALPGRGEPDLTGLAVFTVDAEGQVASWSVTAEQLFGRPADSAVGRPVADVLPAGEGQRDLIAAALAEAGAGRTWSGSLPTAPAAAGRGTGPAALHCEPLAGPGSGALVIARQLSARPGPDLLREAATRIGTTLDLARTAREFTEVAVPAFADAAAIFVSERLLAADEPSAEGPGPAAVVRRLAARLAGQPSSVTSKLLRPGEVLVFGSGSPSYQAMTTGRPVTTAQLDSETGQRLARRPGGRDAVAGYASFLAVPLAARNVVLGCLTFARAAGAARLRERGHRARDRAGGPHRRVCGQCPAVSPGAPDRVCPAAGPGPG